MASKPAAKKAAPAKPATAKAAPKPQLVVSSSEGAEDSPAAKVVSQLKVKDLMDRVVAATDQSRKDVKIIVEAALAELAKSLEQGETLNLPSLGRVRVANQRNDEAGLAMTLKLKRGIEKPKVKKADKEALAEAGEDS